MVTSRSSRTSEKRPSRTYVGSPEGYFGNEQAHEEAWIEEGKRRLRLDPRRDLRDHSPTGFAWGYNGSGPAQLALAIIADASKDDEKAMRYYQAFKSRVLARLSGTEGFRIRADDVLDFLETQEKGGTVQ